MTERNLRGGVLCQPSFFSLPQWVVLVLIEMPAMFNWLHIGVGVCAALLPHSTGNLHVI